jgi:hypothetical protein
MGDIENPKELTSIERALFVAWRLAKGDTFTTSELASMIGLSYSGAYYLMTIASRSHVVPIFQDSQGRWQILKTDDSSSV